MSTAESGDMSLTVLMIVNNQDRSRDFYHHVIGAEIVRDRDPAILRFGNGVICPERGRRPDQRQANRDDGAPR
jgi:catechol 2,3-dioxygenase-like lactoylglutathione lyase family enzyme